MGLSLILSKGSTWCSIAATNDDKDYSPRSTRRTRRRGEGNGYGRGAFHANLLRSQRGTGRRFSDKINEMGDESIDSNCLGMLLPSKDVEHADLRHCFVVVHGGVYEAVMV